MATSWSWKNFSKGTITGSHSTVVTTINVTTGHGARFGTAFPMVAVIWNSGAFPDPADAFHDSPSKAELVKITARVTDALTVVRAQESTAGLDMTDTSQTYKIMGTHSQLQLSSGTLWENAKSHGSIADGVADDTTAVLAAIDAAVAGGTVYFPNGTYLLSTWAATGKVIDKDLRFLGTKGSTIKGTAAKDFLDVKANLDVEGLSFDTWNDVISLEELTGTIDHVKIIDCTSDAHDEFFGWGSPANSTCVIDSIHIEGCKLTNGTGINIHVSGSGTEVGTFNHCNVANNVIEGGYRGVHVGSNPASDETHENWKHVIVQGNSITDQDGSLSAATTPCGVIAYGNRIVINGNQIHGVFGGSQEKWGVYMKCKYGTVSDNCITNIADGGSNGSAVRIKGAPRSFPDAWVADGFNNVICGNTVEDCDTAVRIEGDSTLVTGNVFENINSNAVATAGDDIEIDFISVSNNIFWSDVASAAICFLVQAPSRHVTFNDNMVYGCTIAVRVSPVAGDATPWTRNISHYNFCGNNIEGITAKSTFCFNFRFTQDNWSGVDVSFVNVSNNTVAHFPNGLLSLDNNPDPPTFEDWKITGNICDTVGHVAGDFGYVELNSNVVSPLIIDEVEGDGITTFHTQKIRNGEWDGGHLVIGNGAQAFHIWQDEAANLRWKKGAPANATDGATI